MRNLRLDVQAANKNSVQLKKEEICLKPIVANMEFRVSNRASSRPAQ